MVETALVQEVDLPAIVGQFLINVRLEDLIVELVQNELDAGSTATSIRFGPDSLVCEGDGEPIDEDGWARLRKTLGAGHQVPVKPGTMMASADSVPANSPLAEYVTAPTPGVVEIRATSCSARSFMWFGS